MRGRVFTVEGRVVRNEDGFLDLVDSLGVSWRFTHDDIFLARGPGELGRLSPPGVSGSLAYVAREAISSSPTPKMDAEAIDALPRWVGRPLPLRALGFGPEKRPSVHLPELPPLPETTVPVDTVPPHHIPQLLNLLGGHGDLRLAATLAWQVSTGQSPAEMSDATFGDLCWEGGAHQSMLYIHARYIDMTPRLAPASGTANSIISLYWGALGGYHVPFDQPFPLAGELEVRRRLGADRLDNPFLSVGAAPHPRHVFQSFARPKRHRFRPLLEGPAARRMPIDAFDEHDVELVGGVLYIRDSGELVPFAQAEGFEPERPPDWYYEQGVGIDPDVDIWRDSYWGET